MKLSSCEMLIEQFRLYYPDYHDRAVDWWKSGPYHITFLLDDNTRLEFDGSENTIRWPHVADIFTDNEEYRKEIGRNIRKFMIYRGLNQQEVCERVGITQAMLSRYITGNSMPRLDKLNHLAHILNCEISDLTGKYHD